MYLISLALHQFLLLMEMAGINVQRARSDFIADRRNTLNCKYLIKCENHIVNLNCEQNCFAVAIVFPTHIYTLAIEMGYLFCERSQLMRLLCVLIQFTHKYF